MSPAASPIPADGPIWTEGYAPGAAPRRVALGITACLHAAAIIGFMLYQSPVPFVRPPVAPLVVTLLPMAHPAKALRRETHPPRRPARKVVPRPTSVAVLPAPTKALPQEAMVARLPDPPSPVTPEPFITQASAARPARPTPASSGSAWDSWEGRILARLERFKRYPQSALSRREQGVATIRFRLDRQGHILSSAIARSSGSAALDREALATLSRAQPLPPIPAGRPDELELLVPMEFLLHRT